jgi:hypothetical protein
MKKTANFKGHSFHGKQQCDIVSVIPSGVMAEDFRYPGDDRNSIEVARLQLLFDFVLVPDPSIQEEVENELVEAAFVQNLAAFADERGAPLYRHDGTGRQRQG